MINSMPYAPLQAHEKTIRSIFSDDYAFEIPVYQRPYAWEDQQARDLLTDLLDAMDDDEHGSYFLGSLVLVKKPQAPKSDVIDGQQRLTTLTILISVLRDLTTDPEQRLSRRGYVYQKGNPDESTVDKYRLLTRRKDRDFFRKYIQEDGATSILPTSNLSSSQLRFVENAKIFRDQLIKIDEPRRDKLVRFLMTQCYLVSVEVPDEDSARRIFIVLNSRGLELAPTDILKAELLSRVDGEYEERLADRWEAIENQLGRTLFAELFGHIRMIHERDKPRAALERAFPVVVPSFKTDPDFIGNVLEPIADRFNLLTSVERIQKRFGERAAQSVAALLNVDNKDWFPPALHKLSLTNDRDEIASFLPKLEALAYQLFVTRADVNARLGRYVGVLNEMDPQPEAERRNTNRRDSFASKVGIELSLEEKSRFIAALDGPIYLKTRVCRPLLERLDALLSTGGASYTSLSVEHVLPQTVTANSEWAILFPDSKVRDGWTHRLANLVLLTSRINTKASNWDFGRKKREYFETEDGRSPFPITQSVLEATAWNAEALRERQKKYLKILCDHWQLGDPEAILGNDAATGAMQKTD